MAAGFFAAASFAGFWIGINISFWPATTLRGFLAGLAAFAGAASRPTLCRSASIRSTTFSPLGRSFGRMNLAGALLVDQVDERGLLVVLEFLGVERAGLLVHDVPRRANGPLHVFRRGVSILIGAGSAKSNTIKSMAWRGHMTPMGGIFRSAFTHPAIVRNISPAGACISLPAAFCANVFKLSFDGFHRSVTCRIVWKTGELCGVSFVSDWCGSQAATLGEHK
ncbi:hypothetical protein JQ543_28000 [Bradyrhizobium diazoefficiens]|nr:hypothetical protein [Bradyrhizobium diazoefficiens]